MDITLQMELARLARALRSLAEAAQKKIENWPPK